MYRAFKIIHLLGLSLFLGSVFGHVVASVSGGAPGSPGFLMAREEIVTATRALTLPGLGLLLASGMGMAACAPGVRRQRWFWLHAGMAGLVLACAAFLVAPAGLHALAAARALGDGGADLAQVSQPLLIETVAGAANIALAVAIVAIGVIKPALRWRAAKTISARG